MVKIPEIKKVSIDRLSIDGNNPNVMGVNQKIALKNNMEKYGFLVPIVTNKDFVVADGEHRLGAAKELGMKEVPVIALNVDEVDRRLLRQIMNKLRGEHSTELDISEYTWLLENDDKANDKFIKYLAQSPTDIAKFINPELPEIPEDLIGDYKHKPAKVTITFSDDEDLKQAIPEIQAIVDKYEKAHLSISSGEI